MQKDSTIFDNIDVKLLAKFKKFHLENPRVFAKFRDMCFLLKRQGREYYSAECILQKIRWDHDMETGGEVFKYNSDYVALYARLMIYHYPQFKGFFELRPMKPWGRKISGEEASRRAEAGL